MVILKKVKSATLIEAVVATALIVIVFVIASLVLNNLVLNTFSKNTHSIERRLNELEYQIQNGVLQLPHKENYKGWDIVIRKERIESEEGLIIVAKNEEGNKEVLRKRIYDEE